jgi:hypothetical protein
MGNNDEYWNRIKEECDEFDSTIDRPHLRSDWARQEGEDSPPRKISQKDLDED